jgi:hypothetical protein
MKTQEQIAEEVIKMLNSIEDGSGVDGETMQYILKKTAMEQQMHRQLVLSFPKKETKALLEELAKLNGEFSEEQIRNDRGVIIAAVSEELYTIIKEEHKDWLEDSGHYAFYDLVVAIVDEMMFSKGSMYQRFISKKGVDSSDWYSFAGECFDWFHMGLSRTMITKELLHAVTHGDTDKYFDKVRKKFYELAIDEGEELGTRTLKNFDTQEEAEELKKELEEMFPAMKLFIDTCTYDHMVGNK